MVIVRPGSDGKIKVNYTGGSGSIKVTLDVQGYFTNTQILPPATGPDPERSGNRPAARMLTRSLTDRVSAGVNPVNGNLLLTQNLLNLTGIGHGVNINVRRAGPLMCSPSWSASSDLRQA
jgi:hypothetical protein